MKKCAPVAPLNPPQLHVDSANPDLNPDPNPIPSTTAKGRTAEDIASLYLAHRGYTIMARNLFTPFGEIDILARKDGEYICVEVKSRSQATDLPPEAAITSTKYSRLVRSLLSLSNLENKRARIDVITVEGNRVRRHFRYVDHPTEI